MHSTTRAWSGCLRWRIRPRTGPWQQIGGHPAPPNGRVNIRTTTYQSSPLPTTSIGKCEKRRKKTAYVAFGSNIGDRIGNIEEACRRLDERGIRVTRTSSLWETEPMYVLDQERFVNGTCEVETDLEPLPLLDELQDIERSMGRQKTIDKGPRKIDLDILMYDNQKIQHERLQVPHAGIPEREFVLRPLAELIAGKPIDPERPWKLVQDYLNELPPGEPIFPLTPLSPSLGPLKALDPKRKTHLMAILNITPDSFYDGGIHTPDNLVATLQHFARSGATIIDVGGQSTRPGAVEASPEEEAGRVLPVIRLIRKMPETRHLVVSIDTYRASVAEQAVVAAGDTDIIINDVSAGRLDRDMLPLAARLGKTICLMHMRGTPQTMNEMTDYGGGGGGGGSGGRSEELLLLSTVASELRQRLEDAERAGVRRWRVVLDPGLGFAKTAAQNLALLRGLEQLRSWPGLEGLPWLVGPSRKGFVGRITGAEEPRDRVWGTAAAVTAAVQGGADIVRVHDVAEMGQVVKMADAIWRA